MTWYVIDEFTLLFFILLPAIVLSLLFLLIIWKMGPQARKLGKATILKRVTHVAFNEAGQAEILMGPVEASGLINAGKNRYYEILHTKNPSVTKKFHWKGTGVPVFVGAARKAVAVSPEVLKAVEAVETLKKEGKKLPAQLREYAKSIEVTMGKKTQSLDLLNPLKLEKYLSRALDVDAWDVLLDKRYQAGLKAAGKQYAKMGMVIGVCLIIGLAIFGLMFLVGRTA